VTWFDLAPPYGDGRAEGIFGEFAATRRDKLVICTKAGIAPPHLSSLKRIAKPLVRPLMGYVPGLRRTVAGARSVRRMDLSPKAIVDNLDASLRALRTDYVDVLALHDPRVEDLTDEVVTALERCVADGKVRTWGATGSASDVRAMKCEHGSHCAHIQMPADVLSGQVQRVVIDGKPASFALYSLGAAIDRALPRIHASAHAARHVQSFGLGEDFKCAVNRAVTQAALAFVEMNGGVLLRSMFRREHLAANMRELEDEPARHVGRALLREFGDLTQSGETKTGGAS